MSATPNDERKLLPDLPAELETEVMQKMLYLADDMKKGIRVSTTQKNGREMALARTKIDEALLWLAVALKVHILGRVDVPK